MQRLFSNFANGWPGRGLLLLRVVTAAALVRQGGMVSHDDFRVVSSGRRFGALVSILILFGLWSPLVGTLLAFVEASIAFLLCWRSEDQIISIMLATVAAALAMLGPGAHSIDARLFGRKRIDLRQPKTD